MLHPLHFERKRLDPAFEVANAHACPTAGTACPEGSHVALLPGVDRVLPGVAGDLDGEVDRPVYHRHDQLPFPTKSISLEVPELGFRLLLPWGRIGNCGLVLDDLGLALCEAGASDGKRRQKCKKQNAQCAHSHLLGQGWEQISISIIPQS